MPEPKKPPSRIRRDPRSEPEEDPITPVSLVLADAVSELQTKLEEAEAALAHERREREADALMAGQLLARIATLESELKTAQDVASALDEELRAIEVPLPAAKLVQARIVAERRTKQVEQERDAALRELEALRAAALKASDEF